MANTIAAQALIQSTAGAIAVKNDKGKKNEFTLSCLLKLVVRTTSDSIADHRK